MSQESASLLPPGFSATWGTTEWRKVNGEKWEKAYSIPWIHISGCMVLSMSLFIKKYSGQCTFSVDANTACDSCTGLVSAEEPCEGFSSRMLIYWSFKGAAPAYDGALTIVDHNPFRDASAEATWRCSTGPKTLPFEMLAGFSQHILVINSLPVTSTSTWECLCEQRPRCNNTDTCLWHWSSILHVIKVFQDTETLIL